jgi:hypothetical protein
VIENRRKEDPSAASEVQSSIPAKVIKKQEEKTEKKLKNNLDQMELNRVYKGVTPPKA